MTASHLEAPRFAAWLERQEFAGKLDERDKKKSSEWRRGDRPRIKSETADRILTRLGSHLSELPTGLQPMSELLENALWLAAGGFPVSPC